MEADRSPRCDTPRATVAAPVCSGSELLNLSYTLPRRWPFTPFHLVMETTAGTCDLYKASSFCCAITGEMSEPERHVREAIASFLAGCDRRPPERPCRAVDLGANNGWFTAMMLQLGSFVTSVEPQPDLARAVRQTASLNCWSARSRVINARACLSGEESCLRPVNASTCNVGGWRWGFGPSLITQKYGWDCAARTGLPSTVGGVDLAETILSAARMGGPTDATAQAPGTAPPTLDLIKIDADGPEGAWLEVIERMLSRRELVVGALIVEGSRLVSKVLHRLDTVHGFTFYRLDEHDARRQITREGWDAYSPPGTIARLDRLAHLHKESDSQVVKYTPPRAKGVRPAGDGVTRLQLEDELFAIRSMRHVFRIKRNLSEQAWVTVLNPVLPHGYPPQLVLTVEPDLTEPTFHPPGTASSPEYRHSRDALPRRPVRS